MIAYKGFGPGLVCMGYQFVMGLNVTEAANCRKNGFHCAEDPLDCLSYYGNMNHAEYCIVNAGGDLDEDDRDSKISCTELMILKKLTRKEFLLHGLAFMADHPKRKWNSHVQKDKAEAVWGGYAIVRGRDPIARGRRGDVLAFAKEDPATGSIQKIVVADVDGKSILPNTWYSSDLEKRTVS